MCKGTKRHGAYQLDLPKELLDVHDVSHVSQLRKCVSNPEKHVPHEDIDMQPDLTYRERPVKILEESERRTRQKTTRFFRVQWSNHTEDEATWEREDFLRAEYPYLFEDQQKSRGRRLSQRGDCFDLFRVSFDASVRNQKTQELACGM